MEKRVHVFVFEREELSDQLKGCCNAFNRQYVCRVGNNLSAINWMGWKCTDEE